ncbi:hypothetical protein G6O69_29820 [Pseudenhygromyxa sp. WMMC2535]|uniref:hypothetical protein n=1 Tax=Pseudenhygromyxa sp. WMMC2535 TaxID=2712867 RepID=UPI0015529799|nr:hypothetical protein [Pseudenhygromyxa sp. WMMC2535]NVB42059.1 hypothetical protein [Pseudenhygromyxa sp. WMMC2535]
MTSARALRRMHVGPFALIALLATCVGVAAIPEREVGASPGQGEDALDASHTPEHRAAMIEHQRVLSYPFPQVWPTAIRYLRIDRGFEVTDRDEEAGYILFEFDLEGDRQGSGSLEMFATEDSSGRPSVSVSVSTSAGPVHLPNAILDGLAAKVRAERGQPASPPKREEEPPPKQDDPEDDHSVPLMPAPLDP